MERDGGPDMNKFVNNVGRMIGGAVAGGVTGAGQRSLGDSVVGAAVGAATMFVARRVLPPRVATLGAAIVAGYVSHKLAVRADRLAQQDGQAAPPARRIAPPRKRAKARPAKP